MKAKQAARSRIRILDQLPILKRGQEDNFPPGVLIIHVMAQAEPFYFINFCSERHQRPRNVPSLAPPVHKPAGCSSPQAYAGARGAAG